MITFTFKRGAKKTGEILSEAHKARALLVGAGLQAAAELLLLKALPLVPMDTGTLRASGKVSHEGAGFSRVEYVGFGSSEIPEAFFNTVPPKRRKPSEYALFRHEIGSMTDPKGRKPGNMTTAGTGPDYLRGPSNDQSVQGEMADIIRKVLGVP